MVSPPAGVVHARAGAGPLVVPSLKLRSAAAAAPSADGLETEGGAAFVLSPGVVGSPARNRDLEPTGRQAKGFFPRSRSLASVVRSMANIKTRAARVHVSADMPRLCFFSVTGSN